MRIRTKLFFGFMVVAGIAASIAGISFVRFKEAVRPLQVEIPESIEQIRASVAFYTLVDQLRYHEEVLFNCVQNYAVTQDVLWKQRYLASKFAFNDALRQAFERANNESAAPLKDIQATYEQLIQMQVTALKYVDDKDSISAAELLKQRIYWELKARFDYVVDDYFTKRRSQYNRVSESSLAVVKIASERAAMVLRGSFKLMMLWIFIIVVVSFLMGMLISDAMTRPVEQLTNFIYEVASGEFSKHVRIDSDDEIGELATAFNKMLKNLADYLRNEKLAAMGKLAGIIAHEIRNPLAGISNSVYFLRLRLEKSTDEKIRKHLDVMDVEVANAQTLIEDTLDFAREKEPVMLESDAADVIEKAIARKVIPDNIQVVRDISCDLPPIQMDAPQMIRVFYNLIWNAIQAMSGGGRLIVKAVEEQGREDGRRFIAVSFMDSGSGISHENLTDIFEPFFTTKSKRAGLGLSVCQSIVNAHKGTIEVHSEVGKGTVFTIRLPVA